MAWTIEISPEASEQLLSFPKKHQGQIARTIERLAQDPFKAQLIPLKERRWAGCFRKRVGDYRIFVRLHPDRNLLEVVTVRRRTEKTYQ